MNETRITIFTGHFGSGKTEVAMNYAINLAKAGKSTSIVDLDIVNPYFRTSDAVEVLKQYGIRPVIPVYAGTNVDIPALPAEINRLFQMPEEYTVFDVGGDPEGARALSRYKSDFDKNGYEMLLVVNTKRQLTDSIDKITEMKEMIEYTSRLKVSALVNNTNLLEQTAPEMIPEGEALVRAAAEICGIGFRFSSYIYSDLCALSDDNLTADNTAEKFVMKKLLKSPWD